HAADPECTIGANLAVVEAVRRRLVQRCRQIGDRFRGGIEQYDPVAQRNDQSPGTTQSETAHHLGQVPGFPRSRIDEQRVDLPAANVAEQYPPIGLIPDWRFGNTAARVPYQFERAHAADPSRLLMQDIRSGACIGTGRRLGPIHPAGIQTIPAVVTFDVPAAPYRHGQAWPWASG